MRLETGNLPYDGFEQLADTTREHPLDLEYSLPDYCADIQKILKCTVTPEVSSAAVLGDSLTVDGTAEIRVLYLDAKGMTLRGFDTRQAFTWTMRLNKTAENAFANVQPRVQHVACRAVNARRVDLHITLGFAVSVCARQRTELAERVENEYVETRAERFEVTRAAGAYSHAFILEEDMELQPGRPPIETVLRRSLRWRVESVQVSGGTAAVSGKAELELLYRPFSDEMMPERFLTELPFSETVDCAGITEDCVPEAQIDGGECTVQPREDSVGEYTRINLYAKPTIRLRFLQSGVVRTVTDAFATRGALTAKYRAVALEKETILQPRKLQVRETVSIPEKDLERVLDVWSEAFSVSAFAEKEGATVRGKFTVCVLYQNCDGRVGYVERVLDFTDVRSVEEGQRCTASGAVDAVRFTILDAGTLECTADVTVSEWARTVYSARTLESAELDETAPGNACCAAIYYAAAGESIWEIAKRYGARVSSVQAHNGCTEEILSEARPMLICRR